MQARHFFVAGAALCDVAFRDVMAGAAFSEVAKVLLLSRRIAVAGTRKRDATSNIVAGAAFGECLEKWRNFAKVILFELCKNDGITKANYGSQHEQEGPSDLSSFT